MRSKLQDIYRILIELTWCAASKLALDGKEVIHHLHIRWLNNHALSRGSHL